MTISSLAEACGVSRQRIYDEEVAPPTARAEKAEAELAEVKVALAAAHVEIERLRTPPK